jgi:filamentous hemagglutinin family protein
VAGSGAIASGGKGVTVNQGSTTGIIDWNSFSVGKGNSVTIDNGSGATLNRVTGGAMSRIAGELSATGSVFLVNGQGVVIDHTGKVVTGGAFVASTQDPSGTNRNDIRGATGRVSNNGSITARDVTLAAVNVSNTGTITTIHGGHIWLTGARTTDAGGTLDASNADGNGGAIVVTGKSLDVSGNLQAAGSTSGGRIETSGRNVTLGGVVNAGRGGHWTVDPYNLAVTGSAATTIDSSLNGGTNVLLKTTATGTQGPGTSSAGAGDITVGSALSWTGTGTLTLDAYHSVDINAAVADGGTGGLTILTNDGGTGGGLSFNGGNVSFANTTAPLSINGTAYTLIASMSALQAVNSNLNGNYALAGSLNASGTTGWTPLGTDGASNVLNNNYGFAGNFEGLGNSISNLTVNVGANAFAGLFGYNSGTIRDLSVVGGSVTATGNGIPYCGGCVGGLAGFNSGLIENASSSATVSGYKNVGGLVGWNLGGAIDSSSSTGTVNGQASAGGLVGYSRLGTITNSWSSATVTAGANSNNIGGLLGANWNAEVADSYATGAVTGRNYVGGLVGYNDGGGLITASYATGAVTGGIDAGGLVGENNATITQSYASGNVASTLNGSATGGLVGYNQSSGNIENTYATGAVSAPQKGTAAGGLVGANDGKVGYSYATGAVSGYREVGGLIGNYYGPVVDSYFDTTTSGLGKARGAGNVKNAAGIKGVTTSQLKAGIPSGFSSSIWGSSPSVNGGLPYLLALPY